MKQYLIKVDDEDIVIKGEKINASGEFLTIERDGRLIAVFQSWDYWFEIIEDEQT